MTTMTRKARILTFSGAYLGLQIFLIINAHFQTDKRFGFWMFAESSRYRAILYRELGDGTWEWARYGQWTTPVPGNRMLTYHWDYFVRDFRLNGLDRWKRAKTGFGVTTNYLHRALDYVAEHTPNDRETVRLILKLEYRIAGGPEQEAILMSRVRDLAALGRKEKP